MPALILQQNTEKLLGKSTASGMKACGARLLDNHRNYPKANNISKSATSKGGMPLARLQLGHLTGGGRFYLNHRGEKLRPMVPQFPLAEPAL